MTLTGERANPGTKTDPRPGETAALGTEPRRLVERLAALAELVEAAHQRVLDQYGLRRRDFDVLATLRDSGEPYALTPTFLADALHVTRSAVTYRVDRVVDAKFVHRELNTSNRRSIRIQLTTEGLAVVDAAIAELDVMSKDLLQSLETVERLHLDTAVRGLMATLAPSPTAR